MTAAKRRTSVSRTRHGPERSLAVTPFVDRTADPNHLYFSDGLTEDLIHALSALPELEVAGRASAFRFRGGAFDLREMGAQLNVRYVLEGSILRSGSSLRVSARLAQVSNGVEVWSEQYDREMGDVFAIQEEIVAAVVKALVPALAPIARTAVRRATDSVDAYDHYLKGRYHYHQRSPSTVRSAIECFQQAVTVDNRYALAYCSLADCYGILRVYGWTRAEENRDKAAAAAELAMAIDPSLAESNFSKAFHIFYFDRRWRDAGPYFARARELNPRSPLIQIYSALFATMERNTNEVLECIDRSRRLDPLSPFIHGLSSCAFYIMGRFDDAERAARRALELQPDYLLGLWTHGLALCSLERFDEGTAALLRAISLSRAPFFVGTCGFGLALAGRHDEARQLLAELDERASRGEYVPAHARLNICVGLRDLAGVWRELANAIEEVTPPFSLWVTSGVFLDAYRADAQVGRLLEAWYQGAVPAATA